MTHYIEGIEDKTPLREDFTRTFTGALRAEQRARSISSGQYTVVAHEDPAKCIANLQYNNTANPDSLTTIIADYVMVNARTPKGTPPKPSLYVLAEQFSKQPQLFTRVPLIIMYSGKPSSEIISDPSFQQFVEFARTNPEGTPAIGYRGKSGDLQGDIIDLFRLVKRNEEGVGLKTIGAYRTAFHTDTRAVRYVLKDLK